MRSDRRDRHRDRDKKEYNHRDDRRSGKDDTSREEKRLNEDNPLKRSDHSLEEVHPKKSRWEDDGEGEDIIKPEKPIIEIPDFEISNDSFVLAPETKLEKRQRDEPPEEERDSKRQKADNPIPIQNEDPGLLYVEGLHSCRSVGNFEKLCTVGEGAFGYVYKAKDKKTKEIVALKKVINPDSFNLIIFIIFNFCILGQNEK